MFFYIAAFLGVLAILCAVVLIGITCIGWFGLNGKVKQWVNKFMTRAHDQEFRNIDRVPINTQCYICLQRVKCPAVATCNHSYCSQCILRYIDTKGGREVECPACRQKICVLFRQFEPTNDEQRTYKNKIADYNFKCSEQPGIVRSIRELPNIIRNAPSLITPEGVRFLLSNPRVKIILIMLIYTLSPFDILPEAFLGPLGFLDDSFVLMNIFRQVSGLMIQFAQQQQRRNRAAQRVNA